MALLHLIASIVALLAGILFIASAAGAWYQISSYLSPTGGACTVTTYQQVYSSWMIYTYSPCVNSCSANGVVLNPVCSQPLAEGWAPCVGASNQQNSSCAPYEYNIVQASTAMSALGSIVMFVAFFLFIGVHFGVGGGLVQRASDYKLPIVFAAVGILFAFLALVIFGAGYNNAVINDIVYQGGGCGNGGQPDCPTLFATNTNSNIGATTTTTTTSGPGAAFWCALVAGILAIVATVLAVIMIGCGGVGGSGGGGGGGGGSAPPPSNAGQ